MTPLERAARALALSYICGRDNRTPDDEYARQYANAAWQQHSPQVVAVLTAIREPKGKMIKAGARFSHISAEKGQEHDILRNLNAMTIFTAMIDAALAEGE